MKNLYQTGGIKDANNILPKTCPACKSKLEFDGIHLMCTYENCVGKIAKQLTSALVILDIKGIGEKTIEPFASDFSNIYDLIVAVRSARKYNIPFSLEPYGIKDGSRSYELFVEAFMNIKSLNYEKVIQMLGYDNVGEKLSVQLSLEHAGLEYNYANLERALVSKLRSPEVSGYIKEVVEGLENLGITIDRPKKKEDTGLTGVCMTGSPKAFGFSTKAEFLAKHPNLYEADLKDALFLVTDDLSSTSSKMKDAFKKGIKIKTYGDF